MAHKTYFVTPDCPRHSLTPPNQSIIQEGIIYVISVLIDVDSNYDVIFPSSPQTITPDDIHPSRSPLSPPIVPVDDHLSSDITVDHMKKCSLLYLHLL